MNVDRFVRQFIYVTFVSTLCSCGALYQDDYIKSLEMDVIVLSPEDSLSLERYTEISVDEIVKIDDTWLLLSSRNGTYNLLFLETTEGHGFYAIRKGRGPKEMVNGGNLHLVNNDVVYYDMTTSVCIYIDLEESIKVNDAVIDTLCDFTGLSPKPVYMTSCKYGFISGNICDDNVWYSLYAPDGSVISSVEALSYKELLQSRDLRTSVMLSSKCASSPSGSNVCVASVASPSLSFAKVDSEGLTEYLRYEISPPEIQGGISPDNCSAFMDVVADDDYVYLLYSGRSIRSQISDSCNHMVMYNWDGSPVRHYYLTEPICSMHIDSSELLGISPDGEMIYKYSL